MENGTLEIMLAEVFSTQHNNLTQAFLFGSKFAIDFPSKGEWRLEAPDEDRPGEYIYSPYNSLKSNGTTNRESTAWSNGSRICSGRMS